LKYVFYFYQGKYPTVSFDIDVGDEVENKKIIDKIKIHSEAKDRILPGLEWYDVQGTRHKSINLYSEKEYDLFSQDEDEKRNVIKWMCENMQTLDNIITPLIQNV